MDSYYDILNVNKDSDIKEIKRAYAKLLRKFPPETNPEEFKKIRKAYEAILEIKSRSAHNASIINDTSSNTSTMQNNFSNTGNPDIITKQNGFSNTERLDINTNKTILSKTKLSNKNTTTKSVINSFNINNNSDNENFYINSETDFNEVLSLVSKYCSSNNYQSAINILNSAIDNKNILISQNILYYIQLINIYITTRNMNCFNECIDKINQIVTSSESKGTSAFILGELNNIYLDLYKNNKYLYCKELINKMLEMFPNETNLKSNQLNITMILNFKPSINIFMNDSHILPCLKTLIGMWFDENITDEEKKSILDTYSIQLCHTNIYKLINSLKYLQKKYPVIYNIDRIYFDKLLKQNTKQTSLYRTHWKKLGFCLPILVLILMKFFSILEFYTDSQQNENNKFINNGKDDIPSIYYIQQPLETLPKDYKIKDISGKDTLLMNDFISGKVTNPIFQTTYTNGNSDINFDVYVAPQGKSPYIILGDQVGESNNGSLSQYYNDNNTQQLVYEKVINIFNNKGNKNYCIYYRITTPVNIGISKADLINMEKDLN